MLSIHFSPSPILNSIPSFKKSYETSPISNPVSNSTSSPFSFKNSHSYGSTSSISTTTSSVLGNLRFNGNSTQQQSIPRPALPKINYESGYLKGSGLDLNKSRLFKPPQVHIYNKFKVDESPTGIDCYVQSADSTVSNQNSIISINFDNDSLDFNIKFPNFDNEAISSPSLPAAAIGDCAVSPGEKSLEKYDSGSEILLEVNPFQVKKSTIFSKVKGLWTLKRHNSGGHNVQDNSVLVLSSPRSNDDNISNKSSFEIYSPVSMRIPIKENVKRRISSNFNFFPHWDDPDSADTNMGNNNNTIKFQNYADMLVYTNGIPPTPVLEEDNNSLVSNITNSKVEAGANSSTTTILPKRKLSLNNVKKPLISKTSVKRSLSFSLSRRRNISNKSINESAINHNASSTTTTTNNNSINNIDNNNTCEPIPTQPKGSILKNKINQNFETEHLNSLREQALNVEDFLKNFEKYEMEKYAKEPLLSDLRSQQLNNYYKAKDNEPLHD